MPWAKRAKRAVGGGMGVAADHGHAGQGGAVFRPHDVHDALALGQEGEISGRAELLDVAVQSGDLFFAGRVGNAVVAQLPAGGWRIVVGSGDDGADAPDLATGFTQPFKRLGAGHFVDQMAVDVEDGGAIVFGMDDVVVPEFVVERACHWPWGCFL